MKALVGNWQDDRFGLWLTVTFQDEKLYAGLNGRKYILAPVGPGKYVVPGNAAGIAIEFAGAEKGRPATAHMTVGQSQEFRFDEGGRGQGAVGGRSGGLRGDLCQRGAARCQVQAER